MIRATQKSQPQPYWSIAKMPTVSSPASPLEQSSTASLSVVIPALNAARELPPVAAALAEWDRQTGRQPEKLLVDGGSTDDTVARATALGFRVLTSRRGRGRQLAAGGEAADGDWLLFLHADTRLGPEWVSAVQDHLARYRDGGTAGYFAFRLDDADPRARRIERCVAGRCRKMSLPYGDQGLLIHHDLYRRIGGFRPHPIMEDVAIVRRLGRRRLRPLAARAITSARRYRDDGYTARPVRNVILLALYFAGVPTSLLAKLY